MRNLFLIAIFVATTGIVSPVFALTVSPVRIELTGDPGTTLQGEIELFNEQNEQEGEKSFFTSFENFEPSGDSGAPRFIGGNDGLATWIRSENKIVLESGVRTIVPYSIVIPQNAEPGGHFAAIFFGTEGPEAQGSGQVSVGGKIGVLILLRVSGEITEGGGLLEFTGKKKQKFFNSLPVTFVYRISNTGGDRIVPRGEIKIKNMLRINSATLVANKNDGSILPNSARKFETIWGQEAKPENSAEQKKEPSKFTEKAQEQFNNFFEKVGEQSKEFHFGWYSAKLNLAWGMANQTGNANYSFFIIPWQLLLVAFAVLLTIIFLGKKAIRRYNRFIIAQARAMQQPFNHTVGKQQK